MTARRSRTLALLQTLVDTANELNHVDALTTRYAYRALAEVRRAAPHAVDHVLDYPSVGAWATRTVLLLRRGATTTARPGDLATVAAAAAVHGGVPMTIRLAPDPSRMVLPLPSLGFALVRSPQGDICLQSDGDATELIVAGTTVRIPADPHQDESRWRGIPKITVNKHRQRADFLVDGWTSTYLPPELSSRQRVFDPAEMEQWRSLIAGGWDLLVLHHPEMAREIAAAIRVLTPLPAPPCGLTSATLADGFGCVFLSIPPDARSVAVTLAHELQHAKLTVIMDLFSLLESDTGELFYTPWRTDPRPLVGLLHGTYAHLSIAGFWRRQRHHEPDAPDARYAHTEYARWRQATRDVASSLLASGRLTATGRFFVSAMVQVLDEWASDAIPDEALTLARQVAQEHRTRAARGAR
ncbi:MAG: HEXXH motif domain-containing protein [Pseudonocardiaceae bacterium]